MQAGLSTCPAHFGPVLLSNLLNPLTTASDCSSWSAGISVIISVSGLRKMAKTLLPGRDVNELMGSVQGLSDAAPEDSTVTSIQGSVCTLMMMWGCSGDGGRDG